MAGRIASWASWANLSVFDRRGTSCCCSMYLSPNCFRMLSSTATCASFDRMVESVRMYEIHPTSYNCCAARIVCWAVNPNRRAASCCNVDVLNGKGGRKTRLVLIMVCTVHTDDPIIMRSTQKTASDSDTKWYLCWAAAVRVRPWVPKSFPDAATAVPLMDRMRHTTRDDFGVVVVVVGFVFRDCNRAVKS